VDASTYGAGAVLMQFDGECGKHRPLATFSASFTPTQVAWPTWVKELWAVKEALRRFAPISGDFVRLCWTDHANNTRISSVPADQLSEKILRWWGEILKFKVEMRFLAGRVNPADALSRSPPDREEALQRREQLLHDPKLAEQVFDREEYEDLAAAAANDQVFYLLKDSRLPWLQSCSRPVWADAEPVQAHLEQQQVTLTLPVVAAPSWSNSTPPDLAERLRCGTAPEDTAVTVRPCVATRPFETERGEPVWFMVKAVGRRDVQVKALRKLLLTATLELWRHLARTQAVAAVGRGQGGVVLALLCCNAFRDEVLKRRFVQPLEAKELTAAWDKLHLAIFVKAAAHWRLGTLPWVLEAAPELIEGSCSGVPTLHVLSPEDACVADSEQIQRLFPDATVRRLSGGLRAVRSA